MSLFDWHYAGEIFPLLMQSSIKTIFITVVGYAIALVIGLLLAMARRSPSRWLAHPATWLIEFIRSTPLLIQVYFIFYVLPNYGFNISATQAGIFGIALHYACYTAEVYRSGFNSIPQGQWEAIKALNIPGRAAYFDIIFPQVIRPMVPALGNYFIAMFKDTPVLSAITVVEIMQEAKNIGSEHFRYLEPITLVGCFFLTISIVLAILFNKIEKKIALP
ncbi:amino acid ABC transporter permease [Citrobacter amalonaticus Y19]|uniref:Amino acid ABC transporter permease n=1 Tax=Citrobacter amalonaticus Y19 TaxID=1261127 RepID=A0A0F6TVR3_CITAM|nr:ectoine/hydroxyectoine ABC transporter permease subunit EhuD [Citrobacter amalonaticus]AKE59396.1 amino acid ABC transporter permease [Citrobacter amalonaticus Y19]